MKMNWYLMLFRWPCKPPRLCLPVAATQSVPQLGSTGMMSGALWANWHVEIRRLNLNAQYLHAIKKITSAERMQGIPAWKHLVTPFCLSVHKLNVDMKGSLCERELFYGPSALFQGLK